MDDEDINTFNNDNNMEDNNYSSPMDMYLLSHDALCGAPTDQTITPGWSSRPSKQTGFFSHGRKNLSSELYLQILKQGVPPALRCAVWTTNVSKGDQEDQDDEEDDDIGTLRKVRIVEHGWKIAQQQVNLDQIDEDDLQIPDLGLGPRHLVNLLVKDHGDCIPEAGAASLKRVLYVVQQLLIVEYCPMLPDLTALLLSVMDESLTYHTLRHIIESSSRDNKNATTKRYVAVSPLQHIAWCATFLDLMKKLYPQTHAVMVEINCMTPVSLDPIFKRFFVTILPRDYVKRIMDLYTHHGVETLFRFGSALLCLFHAHMNEEQRTHTITDPTSFWEGIRDYARTADLESFLKMVYPAYTGGRYSLLGRSNSHFPRWTTVQRWMKDNETWAERQDLHKSFVEEEQERPLGFVEHEEVVFVRNPSIRLLLTHWFPTPLKATKLDLVFSTNIHGRTVERFYHHVAKVVYSLTVLEVLEKETAEEENASDTTTATKKNKKKNTLLGMFASQTWHPKGDKGYGSGECFLFRLRPNPICFHYQPPQENQENSNDSSAADQIMRSGKEFISMGIAQDGSSGLRLNEDFTKGTTSPLVGGGRLYDEQVFEVGLVEVYRLVREVDGKPICHEVLQ